MLAFNFEICPEPVPMPMPVPMPVPKPEPASIKSPDSREDYLGDLGAALQTEAGSESDAGLA